MPTNQQTSASTSGTSKSPLVRSRSLRLPSSKTKTEQPTTSSLTRHGSIRQTKSQPPVTSLKPLSVLRKPPVKPKPVFGSKSTENLVSSKSVQNSEGDVRRQVLLTKSPTKHADGHHFAKGVTFLNENHPTPSDSPSSLRSDRSQTSRDSSWSTPDLAVHLKRLTEEHEKLQVEYARVRMQLLDLTSCHQVATLKRDHQQLSHSDSHLASIPENSGGTVEKEGTLNQESSLQSYKAEIVRLQDENRKLQRKYWEQVLNSDSIEDELNAGASQQVVDLIDKLDDKQKELLQSYGRVQELENHLATTTLELHQCQDALQDYQRMLEESNSCKERQEKQLKEAAAKIIKYQEDNEFLQVEISTIAEALQEAEQSQALTEAEKKQCDVRLNELMSRARKLYAKVQDKNLQIQLLQAELDRSQGQARDMLLSQGAELTMTAMHLSEISLTLHSLLTSSSDFAASELQLQKEMLEEIMADLDSDGDKMSDFSPTENDCEPLFKIGNTGENSIKNLPQQLILSDLHKSMPDLPCTEFPTSPLVSLSSNGSEKPVSIVQAILQAAEPSRYKDHPTKQSSLQSSMSCGSTSNSIQSSSENIANVSASENNLSKVNYTGAGAFKPVGTAIPFRPVNHVRKEPSPQPVSTDMWNGEEDRKKASLETQRVQLNLLLSKLNKVFDLTQSKYLTKTQALKDEISQLQGDLRAFMEAEKSLKSELKLKDDEISHLKSKLVDKDAEVIEIKKAHVDAKEELLGQISSLNEQKKCLEAVNEEQVRQLQQEVKRLVESENKNQSSAYFSDAISICDKLSLKQEIVKLKETISQKEILLQSLAQKFSRTKKVLEDNLQKVTKEVEFLDSVIKKVDESLQRNPELVESSDALKSIQLLVSGKNLPDELMKILGTDSI